MESPSAGDWGGVTRIPTSTAALLKAFDMLYGVCQLSQFWDQVFRSNLAFIKKSKIADFKDK